MKLAITTCAFALWTTTACTFFEAPLDDLQTINPPASDVPIASQPPPLPPVPATTPPPLPPAPDTATGTADNSQRTVAAAPASGNGNYLTVATIFDVPESVPNLSFVHFTKRNKRRENLICQALLSQYPITRPADVPANAANLIIWPVSEGSTADDCSSMVKDHEPLDISSQTAEVVTSRSTGPYVMSRNTPQAKQMIYNFSSVGTRDLGSALIEWQRVVGGDVQSWPPVVNAQ